MSSDAQYSCCTGSSLPNVFSDNNSCPTDGTTPIYAPQLAQLNPADASPSLSLAEDELCRKRVSNRDSHVSSLYTRLKTLFTVKGKANTLPTPPTSPQSHNSVETNGAAISPHQHVHFIDNGSIPFLTDSGAAVPIRNQVAPLTPESIDLRSKNSHDSTRSFANVTADFILEKEHACTTHLLCENQNCTRNHPRLLDSFVETPQRELEKINDPEATSALQLSYCNHLVDVAPLKRDEYVDRGEGVHLIEEGHGLESSKTKSVKWGKTPKPPIHWDVLIDDISEPIASDYDTTRGAYFAFSSALNGGDDDFYGLQYALELSRRDRRKLMDPDADSAGEYSKSRESWAILHLDRVMPSQQEYWFRYWLHWHHRLEERAAFKLDHARKQEEFKRYQLVNAWPTANHRSSRNPRQADEDLHPTLRLMRHRTRSAPGRISM